MRTRVRGMSLVEVTAALSIGSIVLIVTVPVFRREVRASHQAEAREGLLRVAERAVTFASRPKHRATLPDAIARTPADVPRGAAVALTEEAWAGWKDLGGPLFPAGYAQRYAYALTRPKEEPSTFVAVAEGDLDGDGILARGSIRGVADGSGQVTIAPEVEFVDALE